MTETNKQSDSCDENKITADELVNRISKRKQVIHDLSYKWPLGDDTLDRLQRNFTRRLTYLAYALGLPHDLPNDKKMFRVLAYALLDPHHYINCPKQNAVQGFAQQDVIWKYSDELFDRFLARAKDALLPCYSAEQAFLGEAVRDAMLIDLSA